MKFTRKQRADESLGKVMTAGRMARLALGLAMTASAAGAAPLIFDLKAHQDAVAIPFDVAKVGNASFTLSAPEVVMESPHAVESAVLPSGITRFVIYSTAGKGSARMEKFACPSTPPQPLTETV